MADDSMDSGSEDRPSGTLDDFDARLRAAQEREAADARVDGPRRGAGSGIGIGLRIGVEMVAGLGVGLAIGWGLDRWLGTKPWLMVLFFFLGAAAGILNAYRVSTGMDDSVGLGAASRRAKGKRGQ